ncbi:MAG: hypothetical protein RL660_2487 [Bacteroidota bacterium]|jgi:predicted enzyme related to lactoylglutathione lyase
MKSGNAITWFEIPVSDFERARAFYEAIFEIEMATSELEGYKMAFFPNTGGVTGAICFGESYIPSGNGVLLYLNASPDLNAVLERVMENHGHILVPKTAIGEGMGYYAIVVDSEGNRLALQSSE